MSRPRDDISSFPEYTSKLTLDSSASTHLSSLKRGQESAATVTVGDSIAFRLSSDTYAAMSTPALELGLVDFSLSNRLIGSIMIEGARPGDALGFSIDQIELDDHGFVIFVAKWAERHFPGEGSTIQRYAIREGQVVISEKVSFPISSMIGWLGTTPARGALPSLSPTGTTGGNLDLQEARPGATVWLPVEIAGAGFAIGDLHARMGRGEPMLAGVECGGTVTGRFQLQAGVQLTGPRIESNDRITFVGCHRNDPDGAESVALRAAWTWLKNECELESDVCKAVAAGFLDLGYGGPAGNNRTASFDLDVLRSAGIKPISPDRSPTLKEGNGRMNDQLLTDYIDSVAAPTPAPGGGSVSAVIGSLGCALGAMAAGISANRKSGDPTGDLARARLAFERIRIDLLALSADDEAAYLAFRTAQALPKSTEPELEVRRQTMMAALNNATSVPLQMAETALAGLETIRTITAGVSRFVLSDLSTATFALDASIKGALANVATNVAMITDESTRNDFDRSGQTVSMPTRWNSRRMILEEIQQRS